MKYSTYYTCYALLLGLLGLASCSKLEHKTPKREVLRVEITRVGSQDEAVSHRYVGEVKAAAELPLCFPMGGEVKALYVHNGDRVQEGQLLAVVDSTQAHSLHQAALAVLQQAEDGYRRLQAVHEKGAVSDVQWVEMQTNLEKARQSEISARKALSDCHLYAPTTGVISGLDIHAGQQLMPGQTLCQLLNLNSFKVTFAVPEQDIADLTIGAHVRADVTAINACCEGKVSEINLSANPVAHTYTVTAQLSAHQSLRPGMVAKVTLTTASPSNGKNRHQTADSSTTYNLQPRIVLPGRCIQTTPTGKTVWVVEDGKAARRTITIGDYTASGVLVTSGLTPNDLVITTGYQKLYTGALITYE